MTLTDVEFRTIIPDFPNYEISTFGRVYNLRTGRQLVLSPTQAGDLTVGLMRDYRQHRYSVKCLVARAFVDGESDIFNTPIQLDGDKNNLHVSNIVWRPRWFAWKYTRQFHDVHNWYFFGPIVDRETMVQYKNYIEAATANGLLCSDIMESIYNSKFVFPTHQQFAYIN